MLLQHTGIVLQNSSRFLIPLLSTSGNSVSFAVFVILFCNHAALIIVCFQHLMISMITYHNEEYKSDSILDLFLLLQHFVFYSFCYKIRMFPVA